MSYFERIDGSAFQATHHVSGGWNTSEQHIAPAMGLLAHVVELDRDARRSDNLVLGRLSFDIYGTIPVDVVETEVRVLRAGRSIELVEAVLSHRGRAAASLRAWLMQRYESAPYAGTPLPRIPPPDEMRRWDPSSAWPGDFLSSVEVRRAQAQPGRAGFWIRTGHALVGGEQASPLARAAGLLDLANGMTVRADPRSVMFPNLDLTAHFFDNPDEEWIGFDTSVSFGSNGTGVTNSVVHAASGPIGTVAQMLTVRPR